MVVAIDELTKFIIAMTAVKSIRAVAPSYRKLKTDAEKEKAIFGLLLSLGGIK